MVKEAILVQANETILLKKAIAKALYSKKIDQSKISKILKLSQPMVSNYCSANDKIPKNISDLAEKISEEIINRNSVTFHTCISFDNKPLEGSFYIARENEIISDEKNKIIDNLTEAFLLLKGKNIGGLIPEVKVNIAMAKDNADNPEDVAAFLNGLIIVDDRVTSYNGIRFGKSKHLSSLLLSLRNAINVNAIMNVAYINNPEKIGFNYSYLTKNFKLESKKKNVDVLLHRGDFGLEPCAYILGKDAVDVVNKVMKLKEEFT
jgi:predicted fused transcriptional regulator/phosphomethylpyrimidine kinase